MRRVGWILGLVIACGGAQPTAAVDSPAVVASASAPAASPFVVVERVLGAPPDVDAPLPWVIALHGMGDRADRFVHAFDGWDGPPVRVLAVQAPTPRGPGFTWFSTRVREADPSVLDGEVARQADALVAALPGWASTYGVTGKPVVTGFSQGGMLSYAVGLRHPEAVAATVPVSGWVVSGLVAPHPPSGPTTPIRALHGVDDDVLAFVPTRRAVDRLRAGGFDITMQSFAGVGHAIPPDMRRAWWATLAEQVVTDGSDTPASRTVAPAGPAR